MPNLPPVPDPARGVFETLLVFEGQPVELDAHLDRLGWSAAEVLGHAPSESAVRQAVADAADGIDLGRVRVDVTSGDQADVTAVSFDGTLLFPPWERGAMLRRLVVPGGLGRHKWVDRRLLDHAEAGDSALALIVDGDGSALEASRANLFAAYGERLVTPPTDGRILSGITRARVIEVAQALHIEVSEEELRLEQLLEADELFLSGSVRGVEPVRAFEDTEIPTDRITASIQRGLRERWLSPRR